MNPSSASRPLLQRDLTLDVFRGLAVVLMLINHTNWMFLPNPLRLLTSYLTVTMFAWCIGAGTSLAWTKATTTAPAGTSTARVYGLFVLRALVRAGILLVLHSVLSGINYHILTVLGYLAVVVVVTAVLAPLAVAGRGAAAAVLILAELLLNRRWDAWTLTLPQAERVEMFGTWGSRFSLLPGDWGNFLFGGSSVSPMGDQYSGLGLAGIAVVGMLVVGDRILPERLMRPQSPKGVGIAAALGLGVFAVFAAASKLLQRVGLSSEVYSKTPEERIVEIGMIIGLWIAASAVLTLADRSAAVRGFARWMGIVGASTLSIYMIHGWILTEIVHKKGVGATPLYTSGLFGVLFTIGCLIIPVLWRALVSTIWSPPAGGRAASAARAAARGPVELVEELVLSVIPRPDAAGTATHR